MSKKDSYVVSDAFGTRVVNPVDDSGGKEESHVTDYGEFGRRRVIDGQAVSGQGGQAAGEAAGAAGDSSSPIRDQFAAVSKIITKAVRAKLDYKAYLAGLEKDKTIDLESVAALKKEAEKYTADQNAALNEEFKARLGELRAAIDKAHGSFDLGDPSLANALKLVEIAGSGLGAENLQTIRAQFANNQPALRALQAAYRSKGVFDGELDNQVYNVDTTFFNIAYAGEKAILRDGAIEDLAAAVGRVAMLEGVNLSDGTDSGGEGR